VQKAQLPTHPLHTSQRSAASAHSMKATKGSRVMAPPILILNTKWR